MKRIMIAVAATLVSLPAFGQTGNATRIGDLVRGTQATLHGTVARIADQDEFDLSDESGSIEVYLGSTRVPVTVGEVVSVTGFVDDDLGPLELCASSITRADGTVLSIPNCDD